MTLMSGKWGWLATAVLPGQVPWSSPTPIAQLAKLYELEDRRDIEHLQELREIYAREAAPRPKGPGIFRRWGDWAAKRLWLPQLIFVGGALGYFFWWCCQAVIEFIRGGRMG